MRQLSLLESEFAGHVVEFGNQTYWEISASIQLASRGKPEKILEMRTVGDPTQADPSDGVITIANTQPVVVHHNHLSQGSLSEADWKGSIVFHEIFAHCAEGTVYYGKALDKIKLQASLAKWQNLEMDAYDHVFKRLSGVPGISHDEVDKHAAFFTREVINRALHNAKIVDYAWSWGKGSDIPYGNDPFSYPAGTTGAQYDHLISSAATDLAKTL